MDDTIEARVTRGAQLLDERLPGWVDRIDLDRLNLASSCNCILGQKFGDYLDGIDALFNCQNTDAINHGFDAFEDEGADAEAAEYEALTAEWRRVILARREQAAGQGGEPQC